MQRIDDASLDYLIVGAGAAGSVLAHRLSARAELNIALIEAGKDLTPGHEPADVRSIFPLSAFNERYMWPDTFVHWRTAADSPRVQLQQGRVIGGSSTIMGMWALRGMPHDYDGWARDGATGWSWQDVLPYFNCLESDQDFGGPLHGKTGPIPIRRESPERWSPLARAVFAECMREGLAHVEDLNADFRDGHCVLPISRFEHSRAAGGICYLTATVRRRPNLTILTEHTVKRLVIEDRRIVGVLAARPDGSEITLRSRETILTAGALRTPVLLLRGGIGPAEQLRDAGIPVVEHRPGVGANLQNHAVVYVCALLTRRGCERRGERPAGATYLRWSSRADGGTPGDMALFVRSYLAWHALGRRLASLAPALQKPASRGTVRLDSRHPGEASCIEFNFLSKGSDLQRLIDAVRFAVKLFDSPKVRAICGEPFVLTNASRLMRFNRVTRTNALRGQLAATLLDISPRYGLALLKRLASMRPAAEVAADDEISTFVRQYVSGTGHVCGTCRMGGRDDLHAVCDSHGRVYGVDGLRVADASVMPSVPSGNTHIPVIMVAEKIAASILRASA